MAEKDTSFYTVVVLVAIVTFIVAFTYVAYNIITTDPDVKYPPIYYTCPDYWEKLEGSNACKIPDKLHSNVKGVFDPNGSLNTNFTSYLGNSFSPGDMTITMDNDYWANDTRSAKCEKQYWSNKYGIEWDGISNFNDCS